MSDFHKLLETLAAGQVRRWHTFGGGLDQNVGNHTYGVLVILFYLLSGTTIPDSQKLRIIYGALFHDAPEIATGDIPAPFLRGIQESGKLRDIFENAKTKVFSIELLHSEERIIFYADKLEAMMFARKNGRNDIAEWSEAQILTTLGDDELTLRAVKERVYSFFKNGVDVRHCCGN